MLHMQRALSKVKKTPKPRGRRNKRVAYQAFKERPKEQRWAMLLTNDSLREEFKRWQQQPESEEFKALDAQMLSRKLKSSEADGSPEPSQDDSNTLQETTIDNSANAIDAQSGEGK